MSHRRLDRAPVPAYGPSPARRSPVTVTGGAGGTQARLTDLERAGATLHRVADSLDASALALSRLSRLVEESWSSSPPTAAALRAAVGELRSPSWGVLGAAGDARRAAGGVRAAAALYADTDGRVARTMLRAGLSTAGRGIGEAGPVLWAAAGAAAGAAALLGAVAVLGQVVQWRLVRGTPTPAGLLLRGIDGALARVPGPLGGIGRVLGGAELLPPGLAQWPRSGTVQWPRSGTVEPLLHGAAAFVVGALPGRSPLLPDPVPLAARHLYVGGALLTLVADPAPTTLVVTPSVRLPPPGPAPTSTSDLVAGIDALQPGSGSAPGSVGIQRLDHPDGRRTWVVTVPGTQEWSPLRGANPADLGSNLQLMAAVQDDVSRLVVAAMEQAGIARDEPVVIAGHSQGGIVAASVAADPEVRRRFSLDVVVTAGSPVARELVPDDVASLHLENLQDLVPATDGLPNTDAPRHVTVGYDLAEAPTAEQRIAGLNPLTAHALSTYVGVAQEVDDSDHPSLVRFREELARVLGDGTATVHSTHYTGTRLPVTASSPSSRAGAGSAGS